MDTLRKRIPFKFTDSPAEPNEVNGPILDEQEQEELIQDLRKQNIISNEWYLILLRTVLGLSFSLQFISLVNAPYNNPFLVIFPPGSSETMLSIPCPALATLSSLVIHINLAIVVLPAYHLRTWQSRFGDLDIHPVSYQLLYIVAAVAPTLSLFLLLPWQSTAWWSLTIAIVFIVHTVTGSIAHGNESIAELESMKYVAPGA